MPLNKFLTREGVSSYINTPYKNLYAPEIRAAQLGLQVTALPIIGTSSLMAIKDDNSVQDGTASENEFEKGLATSAGIGALALPLTTVGLYVLGKGRMDVPIGPARRRWLSAMLGASAGGAILGGGAYAATRKGVDYTLDKIK